MTFVSNQLENIRSEKSKIRHHDALLTHSLTDTITVVSQSIQRERRKTKSCSYASYFSISLTSMKSFSLVTIATLVAASHAFGVSNQECSSAATPMTRSNFLAIMAAGATASVVTTPAFAKDDPSLKGTKKDPAFEACLSKCMYDCTKPKGSEQKSRSECLPECKQTCATTKSQLLKGPVS